MKGNNEKGMETRKSLTDTQLKAVRERVDRNKEERVGEEEWERGVLWAGL